MMGGYSTEQGLPRRGSRTVAGGQASITSDTPGSCVPRYTPDGVVETRHVGLLSLGLQHPCRGAHRAAAIRGYRSLYSLNPWLLSGCPSGAKTRIPHPASRLP